MKYLLISLSFTTLYLVAASPLPGSTIVGPGEPGTIIQGPKSKATVQGANGKIILGGGDTGVIHAKGRDGGVVGASGTSPGIVAASAPVEHVAVAEPAFIVQVVADDVPNLTNIADAGHAVYDSPYGHQPAGYDNLGYFIKK